MRTISWDGRQDRTHPARGFTLVELLIVISIIGVLIALLMPAIMNAIESARRATCLSNLTTLAKGCQAHEHAVALSAPGRLGEMVGRQPQCPLGGHAARRLAL